ncbi:MAG: hypothetical protein U0L57_06415 [Bacteroidales bacterium]|nr:hypothetical protein [Bacteroidales bacterium]
MTNSRTKNVALNAITSLFTQVLMLFLNFISRTIFIKTLGVEYLGVNGVFSNVLTILSFAELGIGNAILYSLYKPLAEKNEQLLCSLMQLFKKIYRYIFIIVLVLGLAMVPFLDLLVKDVPDVKENLTVIYLLFLFDTSISYLYIYKQSIIQADQKGYIVTTIHTVANVIKVIAQIVILYLTHDFLLYLISNIIFRIAGNLYCAYMSNKLYPYIKNKPLPLEKEKSKKIFNDIKSLAAYKFGSIILNSSDSIIISAMVSVRMVGYVSNYLLLVLACKNILSAVTNSFTASLGNLNATASQQETYNVFNKIFLITVWVFGLASIGIIVLSKSFVTCWLGDEYLLNIFVVIAIVGEFYVAGIHTLESHYRYTMGFFKKGKVAPLLAAILNVILSIYFCSLWGVVGVFIATSLARILTLGIIDTIIIYKNGFNRNPLIYFIKNAMFILLFLFIGLLCYYCVSFVELTSWFGFAIKLLIVVLIYNIIMILLFHKTKEFKEILTAFLSLVRKK